MQRSTPRRRVSGALVDLHSLMGSRNAVETGEASGTEGGGGGSRPLEGMDRRCGG